MTKLFLPCLLIFTAALRLWHVGDHGFGTEYYAAAVRSMMGDAHNFFYNAFDPSGALMVDKPPLALWLQVLSARLLGYSPFALMLPQAIEGTLSVWVLWHLVCRDFGKVAAGLAGLFLALTPISVAVDRSNNTDGLLVLVLLLAAWALPRRHNMAAPWRLAAAFALVGVAFNVKMLAAYGVLPGFTAAYFFTADASLWRRVKHLAFAGLALVAVSLSWIGAVSLTPPEQRPYVDSSPVNSIFDLVINHNASQRFIPHAWRPAAPVVTAPAIIENQARTPPPGLERLATPVLASQAGWLLPLALIGAVTMVMMPVGLAAYLWIGWGLAYMVVFSYAGGLFSPYYLVVLAPPLAALAGVGVLELARLWRQEHWRRWSVPAVLIASFAWQIRIVQSNPEDAASRAVVIAVVVGAVLAFGTLLLSRRQARWATTAVAIGVAALLVAPCAWAIGTIRAGNGRPIARLEQTALRPLGATVGQQRGGRWQGGDTASVKALLPFLEDNRNGTQFLAASVNARLAAPLIIATGAPVLAFGGFQGTMPVADGTFLAKLAQAGALRFVLLIHSSPRRPTMPESDAANWVRAHGTRREVSDSDQAGRRPGVELYDLRPDLPLIVKSVKNENGS
jgi:4-amino-4-deoxy-L-arabinose transferase-like glycosyltransferase